MITTSTPKSEQKTKAVETCGSREAGIAADCELTIERIETYPLLYQLKQPYGDANGYKKYRSTHLVRIITRSGLDGWGECVDWLPTLEAGFRERLIPFLLGKLATDRLQLVQVIEKWHRRAAASVSMALTEIVAKWARLSVSELWGGARHRQIPVYASFQSYSQASDWQSLSHKQVEQAVADGFSQVKVKIGGMPIAVDQDHVNGLLAQLGTNVQVALDANQSYDASAARSWERIFSRTQQICWLEEPLPLDRVQDYALLRKALSVPLAGGENLTNGKQFLSLLIQGGLDILQPDPVHENGVDGYRSTIQLARTFGLRCSPHSFDGALSRLYALFAKAVTPAWSKMDGEQIEPVEWDVMENPFTQLISLRPRYGKVTVPTDVGIGCEIDSELLTAYRWDGCTYT